MKYTAVAPVPMQAGAVVKLSDAQARRRRHLVASVKDRAGWFVVTTPLQFKIGETFETDADLPKGMASVEAEGKSEAAKTMAAAKSVAAKPKA